MNAKSIAALTTIVLATMLNQSLTCAQVPQLVRNSMFNKVLVQRSPLFPRQLIASAPPPVEGAPDERTGAGSRAAPTHVEQLDTLL
jgi:hypothetical protein